MRNRYYAGEIQNRVFLRHPFMRKEIEVIMLKILFVDDAADYLKILSYAFKKEFEVYTASGVKEAMALLNGNKVDLVCSDLHMQGETGVDLLLDMKQSGMETPFVLMSGDTDSIEIRGEEYHGATFVPKEWDMVSRIKGIAGEIKENK